MDIPLILIAAAALAVVVIFVVLRKRRAQYTSESTEADGMVANLVILLPEPFDFSEQAFRKALTEALGGDYTTDNHDYFITTVIESAQYLVKAYDTMFLFHNRISPYFPDSKAVAATIEGDDELVSRILKHSAWISFDSLMSEKSESEQFNMVGKVLSQLAPENASALFIPDRGTLIKFDESRRKQLGSGNVLVDLGFEPIRNIEVA